MKKFATLALFALLVAVAPMAQGAVAISYSLNGALAVTCNSSATSSDAIACATEVVGPVNILFLGVTSNSPGGPLQSRQFGTTLQVENTGGGPNTLEIWLSSQDFTFPTTPPPAKFASSLVGTSTQGSATIDLTSCADNSNTLAVDAATFCVPGSISLANTQENLNDADSSSNTVFKSASLAPTFAMAQHITIVLQAGAIMNTQTSSVLTPTPEPASIILLGTTLLGVTTLVRKKFKRA